MSYRLGIGSRITKKRHDLLLAAQAMLVWNTTCGKGCKARLRAIEARQRVAGPSLKLTLPPVNPPRHAIARKGMGREEAAVQRRSSAR